MKKYIKIVLVPILGVVLPFVLARISMEYGISGLYTISAYVHYLYFLYLPVLCGWLGVEIFKETGKVFLPTIIFNAFLVIVTYSLTAMILNSKEPSLVDAAVALLLFGPTLYSVPISPIAAAICKHKKKKSKTQKDKV